MTAWSIRHLLSLSDLETGALEAIVDRGVAHAATGAGVEPTLDGAVLGIYFRKTSTRTRTAFSVGAWRLGAKVVTFGPGDLQLNTGETIEDTARVFAGMLDGLVVRTSGDPRELRAMAGQRRMAVVNAMTSDEHPTQALADLVTLKQQFGDVEGIRVLYVGEGNNTAAALALALASYRGAALHLRAPPGYGLGAPTLERARQRAAEAGALIEQGHGMDALPERVDVVYTTRWETTGTVKADPSWREAFLPFMVDETLMGRWPQAVFMHDLPAHRGNEVVSAVLDGKASIAFQQAENKLYSAMAALEYCLGRLA